MEPITLTRRRFFQALAASVVAAAAPLPVGMPSGYPKLIHWQNIMWTGKMLVSVRNLNDIIQCPSGAELTEMTIDRSPLPYWKNRGTA